MSSNLPARENSYVLDAESGAELARLIDQDMTVYKSHGGTVPRKLLISPISILCLMSPVAPVAGRRKSRLPIPKSR